MTTQPCLIAHWFDVNVVCFLAHQVDLLFLQDVDIIVLGNLNCPRTNAEHVAKNTIHIAFYVLPILQFCNIDKEGQVLPCFQWCFTAFHLLLMFAKKYAHCFSHRVSFLSTTFKHRYIFVVVIQRRRGGICGLCLALLLIRRKRWQYINISMVMMKLMMMLLFYGCSNIKRNMWQRISKKMCRKSHLRRWTTYFPQNVLFTNKPYLAL